ncbi:MAG: hypothetical protein K0R14_1394 [Burkholderiales bacterium]|jgi:hypothetical protein|nr:hypothetical protein [Burkholderiales bacterium]
MKAKMSLVVSLTFSVGIANAIMNLGCQVDKGVKNPPFEFQVRINKSNELSFAFKDNVHPVKKYENIKLSGAVEKTYFEYVLESDGSKSEVTVSFRDNGQFNDFLYKNSDDNRWAVNSHAGFNGGSKYSTDQEKSFGMECHFREVK